MLELGLACFALRSEELSALPKGDPRKLAIGAAIRQQTTLPNAWIAECLHLGQVSRVSHGIRQAKDREHARALERSLTATATFQT